jgi:SMC interacting uncharacterized protein involved in chromosome segregation
MMDIPFDTQKVVERLEQSGVPSEQAKMQAAVLADIIAAEDDRVAERFAERTNLARELLGINAEIQSLRGEVRQSAAEVKADLVRWVVSVGVLQMALIASLILKIIR